jgi:uridine kinase
MAMTRGIRRDAGQFGLELAKAKFINRYHAASIIYIAGNQPESLADIIIDNTDFENLILVKS